MRIAFVTESWQPSLDGVVTRLVHTVTELVGRGHQVLVVAPTQGPVLAGVVQTRTRGFVVPFIDRRRRWGLPDSRVPGLVGEFAPDLVHVVSPVLMGTWAVRQLAGQHPLVASLHTDLNAYASRYHLGATRPLLRRLNRAAYRQADLALATSPTGLDLLHNLGMTTTSIWPPAVDRHIFTTESVDTAGPMAGARNTQDRRRALRIVCVGRLAREKNYDLLRPVVEPASTTGPKIRLTFVGHGPDRVRLQRVFAGTATTFAGRIHGPALAQAYRSADVVVFTSTTDTVGLVLLEAAALARPIVAVDTRATRDTLADYARARLVAQDATVGQWHAALAAAAESDVVDPRASWPASWAEATDLLLEHYAQVLSRWSPARARGPARVRLM